MGLDDSAQSAAQARAQQPHLPNFFGDLARLTLGGFDDLLGFEFRLGEHHLRFLDCGSFQILRETLSRDQRFLERPLGTGQLVDPLVESANLLGLGIPFPGQRFEVLGDHPQEGFYLGRVEAAETGREGVVLDIERCQPQGRSLP